MNNFKLVGKTKEELQKQIQTVRTFSGNTHMEFGLEKYTKTILKIGTSFNSQNLKFGINNEIQDLEQGQPTYCNLRTDESEGTQH
jgi:hypothetical protein